MEIPRITPSDVRTRQGRGEQFVFVDARNPTAWSQATDKIAGAIRIPADQVDLHAAEIPRGPMVIAYCT